MTYTELTDQIQDLIDANDGEGLLDLITTDNLNVIAKCIKKPFNAAFVQVTNPRKLLDSYKQIVVDLAAAGSIPVVLGYFIPGNVVLRSYGIEYRQRYAMVLARFQDAGVGNPVAFTEAGLENEADNKVISQNTQPVDPCL